ncbi:MAG: GNAT family N-acetyltransferase, partial [Pseudomonadota bacterium]
MDIREATSDDFAAIWPIFEDIVSQGETYAYPRDTTRADAERLWMTNPRVTFVAEDAGVIVGTYFLKTNQDGPGDHVCNYGYMVAAEARGAGVASALCTHSQQVARELGYAARQFNFVAATNAGAVRLWQKLGF